MTSTNWCMLTSSAVIPLLIQSQQPISNKTLKHRYFFLNNYVFIECYMIKDIVSGVPWWSSG